MLAELGLDSINTLIEEAIPAAIRDGRPLALRDEVLFTTSSTRVPGEQEALSCIRELADQNEIWRTYIGMGYHSTITPSVILRTVLENPCWYTQYQRRPFRPRNCATKRRSQNLFARMRLGVLRKKFLSCSARTCIT